MSKKPGDVSEIIQFVANLLNCTALTVKTNQIQ